MVKSIYQSIGQFSTKFSLLSVFPRKRMGFQIELNACTAGSGFCSQPK